MLLQAPAILIDGALRPGWLRLREGRIEALGSGTPPETDQPPIRLPHGVLAPGLVDAQCNGAFGHDLATADRRAWSEILTRLPATGTTAFAPTFTTAPIPTLVAALERYHEVVTEPERSSPGRSGPHTRPLGVHLEGPFLAESKRGAHPAADLIDPDPEPITALLDAAEGALAYVTLAPERRGAIAAIERLRAADVRVAIGHSDASSDEVHAAVDAGATLVTHLYNAQRPLHHRDPGVVGAALSDRRLTCGLIVDGHHVHPRAVEVAFAAAAGRIMLVTDATAAMGMPPGTYDLGGQQVFVPAAGPPRREDGAIAGSALSMDAAIRNTVACGVPLANALQAATQVPADALGRHELGRLAPGLPGDLVWLDDDLHVAATWIRGRLAHHDRDRAADARLDRTPHPAPELDRTTPDEADR